MDDALATKLGELLGTGADFWMELQKQRGPVRPYSAQIEGAAPIAGPEPVGQTTAPVIPAPALMQEVKPLSLTEDPGNWEHAEYAWDLLRHDRYVEIEPNFLMAAVDESGDDDPLTKDLLRKLMIFEQGIERCWQSGVFALRTDESRRAMTEDLTHAMEFSGIFGLNGDGVLNHVYSSYPHQYQ